MRALLALAGVAALAGSAVAAPILESEGNNTALTANFVGNFNTPGGSAVIDGTIVPGDVDVFTFTVTDSTFFVASIFGIPNSSVGDSQLVLFNQANTIVAADDDSNIGFFSALEAFLPAGTYFLAVTGFDDSGFSTLSSGGSLSIPDGRNVSGALHPESFGYKMTIGLNVIPTPGSLALLGIGGLVAGRRARRN